MRIISKTKDYYDGGAVYGVDMERVYVRERQVLPDPNNLDRRFDCLGFCGELYLMKDYSVKYGSEWDKCPKKWILWGQDAVDYNLEDDGKRVKSERFWRKSLDEYIEEVRSYDLFIKYKTPIFVIGSDKDTYSNKRKLILNPMLKDYYFQAKYGTVEAFQMIEQFISNQLATELQPDIPVGGNEVLGRSKGFDEYSFRHPNTKKKPKRF